MPPTVEAPERATAWRWAAWAPWAALVALAFWFRVTSLESLEGIYADEAYWGIQAGRLIAGKSVAPWTMTGNPANVLMIGTEAPLIALFGPRFWILRAPTAAAGVLVVVMAYVWGKRWSDKPTALVAATALAVMPIAIVFSRSGLENGVVPLFSLLTLHQAYSGRRFGTLLAFLAALVVHPTAIFVGPVAVAVYLGRTLPNVERSRWWRVFAEVGAGSAAVLATFGLFYLRGGGSESYRRYFFQTPDLAAFTLSFGRFLQGWSQYEAAKDEGTRVLAHDVAFWAVALACLAFGLPRLVRRRAWAQLALVASLPPTLFAFQRMAGSSVFYTMFYRYGAGLLVPSAFAFAFLARDAFARVTESGGFRFRPVPVAVGLLASAVLLAEVKAFYFAQVNPWGAESVWTLGSDGPNVTQQVYDRIRSDVDRDRVPGRVHAVLAESRWSGWPLEYLAIDRPDLTVIDCEAMRWKLHEFPGGYEEFLDRRARAGDYFLGRTPEAYANLLRVTRRDNPKILPLLPPDFNAEVRPHLAADRDVDWKVGHLVIHHLKDDARPPVSIAEGPAGDPASSAPR